MAILERRERQKENLRQQILEAARDLFIEDGYENLSMRKIAERIDYSPTTIYLYFKDKADLLRAICDETFAELIERFEELRKRNIDSVSFFKESARIYMNIALENPNQYRVTFLMPSQGVYGDLRKHDNPAIGAFDYLRSTIEAMMNEGHIRKGDVELAAQLVYTSLHGLCAGIIMQTDFPWLEREQLTESMIDQLLRGLR